MQHDINDVVDWACIKLDQRRILGEISLEGGAEFEERGPGVFRQENVIIACFSDAKIRVSSATVPVVLS